MLLIFASYYLYRLYPAYALPLPFVLCSARESLPTSDSPCRILGECRTMTDIVWSCLATIFACNWVAIHPNLPAPTDSWLLRSGRRVGITLLALVAPEVVIMWAMRQWLAAREARDLYREHGWTTTHGFFAIMGGFMLYDERGPKQVLSPEQLKELAESGTINFPRITEGEIQDRSKGDFLAKGVVVLQTTWFVVQCCARGIEGLPLTELEIVTLAYAAVNFVTYAIWWNKPLNVQYAFRVEQKQASGSGEQKQNIHDSVVEAVENEDSSAGSKGRSGYSLVADNAGSADERNQSPSFVQRYFDSSDSGAILLRIVMLPSLPFYAMAAGSFDDFRHPLRVPTFSSKTKEHMPLAVSLAAAAVATGFGAIHCIAWSFEFPSSHERLLWRISATAITVVPPSLPLPLLIGWLFNVVEARANRGGRAQVLFNIIGSLLGLVLMTWVWMCLAASSLYVVARVDILVQAFIALRAPPEGVFRTVQWTTFIPHI